MSSRTTRTSEGNYFEDLKVGRELIHPIPRTLTEGDAALYLALTGDRSPLHCSAEHARSLGFERETIHDLLTFHMVFGKTVNDISLNAVANLGYADLRFLRPVYPGDTLRATSTVIGAKENSSGKTGVVWVRTRGTNQRDEAVLEYVRWVMVHKREPTQPTGVQDVPSLPRVVPIDRLAVPPALQLQAFETWASGGTSLLEDYAPGDRVHHVDGMTIEEAEHAMATRLYQNTAKVHFNAHAMKASRFGGRLMYGGHVISICHALAFRGLENALGILAFNAGTHAAPTFAGDTLYAFSDVLDVQPLGGREDCGALRVRRIGLKNHDPREEAIEIQSEVDGKLRYHPSVVLDLDLWLLMPRRGGATS